MSANKLNDVENRGDDTSRQKIDDRQGLFGLIALISLAIPVLLARNLLPDLNPIILAGFGIAIYALYLVLMMLMISRQADDSELTPEPAPVRVDE